VFSIFSIAEIYQNYERMDKFIDRRMDGIDGWMDG
jgi:hypothetical protein